MYSKWAKKGFSIVELTVVIAVLGILTTIVIISYNGFQERTRDSERKSDIAQLRIALDKYYADNSQYPGVCASDDTACSTQALETELSPYINSIPIDPKFDDASASRYEYTRGGTSGNAYGIRVMYEVEPDCVVGVRVVSTWWASAYPEC